MEIRTTFRSALYLGVAMAVARVLNFTQMIILARTLPKQDLGDYSIGYTLAILIVSLSALGISSVALREAVHSRSGRERYVTSGMLVRFVAAVCGMGVGLGIAFLLPWRLQLRSLAVIFCATAVALSQSQINESILILYGKARIAMLSQVLSGAVQLALLAWVVLAGHGVVLASICVLFGRTVHALVTGYFALRHIPRPWPRPQLSVALRILRLGWPVGLNGVAAMLCARLDIVLLSALWGSREVAVYAAAFTVVGMPLMLLGATRRALVPFLTRGHRDEPSDLLRAHNSLLKFLTVLTLPGAVLGTLFARPVLTAIFGNRYWEAGYCLQVLAWIWPPAFLCLITNTVLLAGGRQKFSLPGTLARGMVGLLLALLFIPRYGYVGAAVATTAGHYVQFATLMYLCRRHLHKVEWLRSLSKPVAATLAMLAAAAACRPFGSIAQGGAALVAFLAVLALLRPMNADEKKMLWKALGVKRPG